MRKVLLLSVVIGLVIVFNDPSRGADANTRLTRDLIEMLLRQGVSPEQILGVDAKGIPLVSETTGASNGERTLIKPASG